MSHPCKKYSLISLWWKSLCSRGTVKHQQFEDDKWTLPWGTHGFLTAIIVESGGLTGKHECQTIIKSEQRQRKLNIYLETAVCNWSWVIRDPLISSRLFSYSVQGSGRRSEVSRQWQMDRVIKTKSCCRGSFSKTDRCVGWTVIDQYWLFFDRI